MIVPAVDSSRNDRPLPGLPEPEIDTPSGEKSVPCLASKQTLQVSLTAFQTLDS